MHEPPNQIHIQDVRTDVIVTEGIGPLSQADMRRLVALVLEHVQQQQEANAQRKEDTAIANRVDPPHVR
ncbi:MAG TPA: hypothetical protein VKB88_23785 [Bryobacteraceae bacterium]|nr:hypothetical protein [Bryobacteraceae bacterium]